jgi:hypothetical protein
MFLRLKLCSSSFQKWGVFLHPFFIARNPAVYLKKLNKMNRFKILLPVLFLFVTTRSVAQTKATEAVRKVLATQSADWNTGNIEAFMEGYWKNDSLMFVGKNGITYGWANTLSNYKKGYPDPAAMGKLEFTLISVKKLSEQYVEVIGKWHLQRSIGDLQGHFSLLFQKINNKWVIIIDHTS